MTVTVPMREPTRAVKTGAEADQRLVMYAVSWSAYEAQMALRGEASVPRVAYLDGTMELTRPSRDHERIKSYIGRLIEAYALERGLDLSPYGAWPLRNAPRASGLEPDECFIIGADQSAQRPDLAIEVHWTSGSIDKLEIYRRLGVPEVWIWRDGAISVHVLSGDQYTSSDQSSQLPGIDLVVLTQLLDAPTLIQAVRAFRKALAG